MRRIRIPPLFVPDLKQGGYSHRAYVQEKCWRFDYVQDFGKEGGGGVGGGSRFSRLTRWFGYQTHSDINRNTIWQS